MTAAETIRAYYEAFNRQDMDAFLALLHDEVVHDINQGERQTGKAAFASFMDHMNRCYKENLTDMVIPCEAHKQRDAAEALDIIRHIGRPAKSDGLRRNIDHRNRSLGRNPRHGPPVVAIHHQIANNGNTFSAEPPGQTSQSVRRNSRVLSCFHSKNIPN